VILFFVYKPSEQI